jgi:hypothetical protein
MNSTNKNLSVASTPASASTHRVCVVFGSEEKENIPADFPMGGIQVVIGDITKGGAAAGESFTTFKTNLNQRFEAQAATIAQMRGEYDANFAESARVQAATIAQMRGEYDANFAESARVQAAIIAESARVQAAIIAESTRVHNLQQVIITQMRRSLADMDANMIHMDANMIRRLDMAAKECNQYQYIVDQQRVDIAEQRVDIDALLQRNNDLTIDRGLIDELSGYRDEAVNAALSLNRAQALIDDLSTFRNWAMCPLCSQQERRDTICLPCNHTVCADCCIDHVCRVCLGHIANRLPLL